MIQYYKFCCKIRIADETAPDMPGAELVAAEDGDVDDARARFAGARDGAFSDWFDETPALAAHIKALRLRHHSADTGNPGERMISTALAVAWTGRERQVLYRWEREGRITRYGPANEAFWDIFELPARGPGGPAGPPPPVRTKKSSKKA